MNSPHISYKYVTNKGVVFHCWLTSMWNYVNPCPVWLLRWFLQGAEQESFCWDRGLVISWLRRSQCSQVTAQFNPDSTGWCILGA